MPTTIYCWQYLHGTISWYRPHHFSVGGWFWYNKDSEPARELWIGWQEWLMQPYLMAPWNSNNCSYSSKNRNNWKISSNNTICNGIYVLFIYLSNLFSRAMREDSPSMYMHQGKKQNMWVPYLLVETFEVIRYSSILWGSCISFSVPVPPTSFN